MRSYKLVSGEGDYDKAEGCWMSIGRWMVGELGWTDKADCISPVIRALCIKINDMLTNEERLEIVGPRLLDPFGSAGSPELEYQRACWLADSIRPIVSQYGYYRGAPVLGMGEIYRSKVIQEVDRGLVECKVDSCMHYWFAYEWISKWSAGTIRQFVEERLLPVMYTLIDMGDKAPVEKVNACKLECAV